METIKRGAVPAPPKDAVSGEPGEVLADVDTESEGLEGWQVAVVGTVHADVATEGVSRGAAPYAIEDAGGLLE